MIRRLLNLLAGHRPSPPLVVLGSTNDDRLRAALSDRHLAMRARVRNYHQSVRRMLDQTKN